MRLDKYLSHIGIGTRKEVKKLLKEGLVTVNGEVVKRPVHVDPEKDIVEIEGEIVKYREFFYYMLNKPQGYITATKSEGQPTVLDLLYEEPVVDKLFPVGRLDIDTEGLLILTNDGQFAHRISHPKWEIEKEYYAVVKGKVEKDKTQRFEKEGVNLGNYRTKPFSIEVIKAKDDRSEINITVKEGKYHIVKRIMEKLGHPVLYLKRVRVGNLVLDETLEPGEYRELSEGELYKLKELVKMQN